MRMIDELADEITLLAGHINAAMARWLELVAEFDVKEYDIAALVPIVTEAGGRFTSFDGNDSISERSSLATNRVLHDAYLDLLHTA